MPKTGPNKKMSARNAAVAALIAKHETEFHALFRAECDKVGVKYEEPVSPEERQRRKWDAAMAKARKTLEQTLKDFPELAAEFSPTETDPRFTEPTF